MAERVRTDPPEDAKEEDTGDSQTEPAPGVVWTDRASLPHRYTVASPAPPYPRHQAGKRTTTQELTRGRAGRRTRADRVRTAGAGTANGYRAARGSPASASCAAILRATPRGVKESWARTKP